MPRYKLTLEYDGAGLVGWQRQTNGLSVQEALETAVERFCGETVTVHGAGRTDAGVHALGQVRASRPGARGSRPSRSATRSTTICARPRSACSPPRPSPRISTRGARRSGRVYLYRILNRRAPPALERGRVWHVAPPLDVEAMQEGARLLSASTISRPFATRCARRTRR